MGKLDNKVAIVTGAGQGIGRAIATELVREGAAIVITEINEETCHKAAEDIRALGARALPAVCDVRRREQVNAAVATTIGEFGTVDILVNNAQAMRDQVLFEDTTDEDMALALESGFYGTFYFMQACFPYLKRHGGKVINLASAAGTEGAAGWTAYAAAKEAIRAITKVAAREWGRYQINVNAICPLANTPQMQDWQEAFPDQYAGMLTTVPLARLGDPEKDIGRAVVFLASPDSDYITGHTLMVDGGQTILR